jgi:dTDP-4-dehydrorhamnose reductase
METTRASGSTRRQNRRRFQRSRERLAAEQDWIALGKRAEKAVVILRLSGIYGPGQNAFTQLRSGRAKRIEKPGQFFNRIHVADIAQAIDAAIAKSANGILNVTDDKPTAQGVPIASRPNCSGSSRRRRSRSPRPRKHERDGAVVLWREQARAQRQAQA